ncbi:MAG: hypothetical protein U0X73_04560 [Thermoanaerobaculia bacterium]
MLRVRKSLCLLPLGVLTLALAATPAVAAEAKKPADARTAKDARLEALLARLDDKQRAAVEAFRDRFEKPAASPQAAGEHGGMNAFKTDDRALQIVVSRRTAKGMTETACVRNSVEYAEFLLGELSGPAKAQAVATAEE